MDLDDFKATWQAYGQQLDSTQRLGQQLLDIVLRNRSRSTIEKMIRELRLVSAMLLAIVLLFGAIVAGNPFDYTKPLHFVPACCYIFIAGVGLYFLKQHYSTLRRAALHSHDLYQALSDLIRIRTRHTTLIGRVWMLGMLAGSMIMLPNIARKFPLESWVSILLIVLLPIGITAASVGLAKVAGLFTDHYLSELRQQLKELEELR